MIILTAVITAPALRDWHVLTVELSEREGLRVEEGGRGGSAEEMVVLRRGREATPAPVSVVSWSKSAAQSERASGGSADSFLSTQRQTSKGGTAV